jgi:hypothetical protein
MPVMQPALAERELGLEAWKLEQDLEAVNHFRRSASLLTEHCLEWAISMRLYGLALIRIQREVEGTFALEKADTVLDLFGIAAFDQSNIPYGLGVASEKFKHHFIVKDAFRLHRLGVGLHLDFLDEQQTWQFDLQQSVRLKVNNKIESVRVVTIDFAPRWGSPKTGFIVVIEDKRLGKVDLSTLIGQVIIQSNEIHPIDDKNNVIP